MVLRAFSSLRDGIRQVDGWVLPLLSLEVYEGVILPAQAEIKRHTADLEGLEADSSAYARIVDIRRRISHELWQQMCEAYRFRNFRGEERTLAEAVLPEPPITGGIGERCTPKLLQHAAVEGLRPLSLSEFYWAEGPPKGGRISGAFYSSCAARCHPILGFMLCGLKR